MPHGPKIAGLRLYAFMDQLTYTLVGTISYVSISKDYKLPTAFTKESKQTHNIYFFIDGPTCEMLMNVDLGLMVTFV